MSRFSQVLREHAQYPVNQGAVDDADLAGRASLNGNPPYITLFLRLDGQRIGKAGFEAAGCGVTTAVCSATTELLAGKTLEECRSLSAEEICASLEGVPPDKMHCVHVVLLALSSALSSQAGEGDP